MNVTSKISVDMTRQNVGQRINAVQGDGNTRLVEITLLSSGQPWSPPEGVEAAIAYMQPGGSKGLYNKLADGTAAISISGNVATVILAPQMLTVSGTVQASLAFNDQQLNRLTTFPFAVSVTSNPATGAQKTEDYIRLQWLEDKLDEYLRKAADSGAFDGADGKTPEYGVDYGTQQQIADIANKAAGILDDDIQKISDDKVDKVEGKGLSSNDYDNAAKAKVDAIPENPQYTDTVYDDTEVKQGLSQIKDDKLDKAQGTENAGKPMVVGDDGNIIPADIPEKPFVKIADITLAEAASVISITEDMGGNPFALREIVARISFPVTESAKTISLYFGVKPNPTAAFTRIQTYTNNASGTESRCYAVITRGRIMNISSAASTTNNYYQPENAWQILQGIGMLESEKFDELYVFTYTGGGFPAGSRVVIEGVPM